jgi:hypothetical protein
LVVYWGFTTKDQTAKYEAGDEIVDVVLAKGFL